MKTHLIPLEAHDDLISVRDRMSWAKTPRILLIWPKYERIALRPLDLKLLQRHAAALGAQLGLVTRLREVRRQAMELGLPVFESTGAAQREQWPAPPRAARPPARPPRRDLRRVREQARAGEGAWRALPGVRLVFFALGALSALALVGLFIPRATLALSPLTQMQRVVVPVRADANVAAVSITGSLPARRASVVVAGSQSVATSGEMAVPLAKARGVARFTNLTLAEQIIPAGTVVYFKGEAGEAVRFATLRETRLPAGAGQFVESPIEALEAGTAANLEAGAIQAIEGGLGLSLAVTNPEATSGGRAYPFAAPSEADRERLRQLLLAALEDQASQRLEQGLSPGDVIFPATLSVAQVLEETYDPPPAQPGRTLTLNMRVEYVVSYASSDDLTALAEAALNAALPEGYVPDAASLTIEPATKLWTDADGVTHWRMSAERRLLRQINPAQAIRLARGLRPDAAGARLRASLALSASPQISLSPAWWPWLPLIPFRITVTTQ